MKIDKTWFIGLSIVFPLAGCPGDDTTLPGNDTSSSSGTPDPSTSGGTTMDMMTTVVDPSTSSTTEMLDDSSSGDPPGCPGMSDGTLMDGDPCVSNDECASGVCTIYTDVPLNKDAVCAAAPPDCNTRITGTVFDFATGDPVGGATVNVVAALDASLDPTGATGMIEATSDGDGRVDERSAMPLNAGIGIVGLSSADGFYLTATGLASPVMANAYGPANAIHDIWVVPSDTLTEWSDELMQDMMIEAELLPLGDAGGVVGLVRDSAGNPLAGAEIASTNAASTAVIRYLNDDGSFGTAETSELGIFVLLDPMLAEVFEATVGGMVVGDGTVGSSDGVVFTLIVNAP